MLIALGEAQQDVAQEEKPVALYLSALRQLLHQGTLYLRSREYPDLVDREYPKLSVRAANAEFVGWYDDQYIYLLSKVALRVVHKFYRDSGVVFPDTEHGVKVKLKEQGLLFPAESGANLSSTSFPLRAVRACCGSAIFFLLTQNPLPENT